MGAHNSNHAHDDMGHASRSLSHATDDILGCCDAKKVEQPMTVKRPVSRGIPQWKTRQGNATGVPDNTVKSGQLNFMPLSIIDDHTHEGKWVPIPRGSEQEIQSSLPVVDHPHLSMYFMALLQHTDPSTLPTSRVGAESLRMLKVHAAAAFQHHDLNRNGVLDQDESKVSDSRALCVRYLCVRCELAHVRD